MCLFRADALSPLSSRAAWGPHVDLVWPLYQEENSLLLLAAREVPVWKPWPLAALHCPEDVGTPADRPPAQLQEVVSPPTQETWGKCSWRGDSRTGKNARPPFSAVMGTVMPAQIWMHLGWGPCGDHGLPHCGFTDKETGSGGVRALVGTLEGDDWMASLTQWTWVWANSER